MTITINGVEIDAEVLPIDKPSLDETLETFSFALVNTNIALPFAPMQNVEIETDEEEIISLVIATDTVEVFSLYPLRYKHSITCVENTRFLSKHLVRNSIITQPANPIKEGLNAFSFTYSSLAPEAGYDNDVFHYENDYTCRYGERTSGGTNSASIPLTLTNREKIKEAFISIEPIFSVCASVPGGVINYTNSDAVIFDNLSQIQGAFPTITCIDTIQLRYELNNQTITENISIANIEFNKLIKNARIKELADLGANNFELIMPRYAFFTGVIDPLTNDYTLFYTFTFRIVAETYYYSVYDVLELLLKRQQKHYKVGLVDIEQERLFNLPVSGDLYNLLVNTVAPNFTFTQMTFYNCVEEIFRLFDAIFTLDEYNTLGITFFNTTNKENISTDFSNMTLSIGEDNYNNGFVSYYQDARIREVFPGEKDFAPVRSLEFGVPDAQDHNIIVPHPIHHIEKLYIVAKRIVVRLIGNQDLTINFSDNYGVDLSHFVLNSSVWSTLDKATSYNKHNTQKWFQINTFHYERGSNYIPIAMSYKTSANITHHQIENVIKCSLSRLFGVKDEDNLNSNSVYAIGGFTPTDWYNQAYRVVYIATVDGRTQIETITDKYNGQTIIDQQSGGVDLNKLGLNMLGLSLKLGEPTLNATQKIVAWEDRVKIGDVLIFENKRWIANVVAYTILNGYVQAKISFVKDFNSLSLRTKLLRERRFSNIAGELVAKSEENIINYAYFSTNNDLVNYIEEAILTTPILVVASYLSFTHDENYGDTIDFAMIETNNKQFYFPMIIYGSGNTINFEMSFNEPMNAGNRTTYGEVSTWYGASKYFTDACEYTDDNGFLDDVDIYIIANSNSSFSEQFPIIEDTYTSANFFASILNYECFKQPNEILALNYEIAFIPFDKDKDFFGSEFINKNFFTERKSMERKLYIFYSNTELYDVLDTKGIGVRTPISSIIVDTSNFYSLTFITANNIPTHKSWSICDENGNILFASNNGGNATSVKTIYFAMRHSRITI